jgi:hypothetical protein
LEKKNIFRWYKVRLNHPGSPEYDPKLPWVSKVRKDGNTLAADAFYFVDDARPTGPSKKEAWQAARKVGSTFSWLGIQDAAQKRRDSSQRPGAWAGAVVVTTGEGVYLLVSQEKWDKVKVLLTEVIDMWETSKNNMSRKRFEQIRSFFKLRVPNVLVHDPVPYRVSHDDRFLAPEPQLRRLEIATATCSEGGRVGRLGGARVGT